MQQCRYLEFHFDIFDHGAEEGGSDRDGVRYTEDPKSSFLEKFLINLGRFQV